MNSSLYRRVSLDDYTTWGVGGEAKYFLIPETSDELIEGIRFAISRGIPYYPLGSGSNVLFPDDGYPGLIVYFGSNWSQVAAEGSSVFAQAGLPLSQLISFAQDEGWDDFNYLTGIPGTVGGGLAMNAGADGSQLGTHARKVRYIDSSGQIHHATNGECQFGYRESLFQNSGHIIMEAELVAGKASDAPSVERLMRKRAEKYPLGHSTAGCVFKNPVGMDLTAGQLIDRSGCKGLQCGDASVSYKHANFIINRGRATSTDVLNLIDIVKERVYKHFGVTLSTEIRVITEARTVC